VVVSEAIPEEVVRNGINGFRIFSFEPNDYAAKHFVLFKNDNLWKKISRHACEEAEKYTYTNVAKQYENIIRWLL